MVGVEAASASRRMLVDEVLPAGGATARRGHDLLDIWDRMDAGGRTTTLEVQRALNVQQMAQTG